MKADAWGRLSGSIFQVNFLKNRWAVIYIMHNGWFNFFRFLNAVPFPPAARLVVRKPLCFFGGIGLVLFCLRFFSAPLLFSEVRSPPAGRRENPSAGVRALLWARNIACACLRDDLCRGVFLFSFFSHFGFLLERVCCIRELSTFNGD